MNLSTKVSEAVEYIKNVINIVPDVAVICGSGVDVVNYNDFTVVSQIQYANIPFWPQTTVEQHKGLLIFGTIKNKTVVVMQGRVHYYEGYSMEEITFPVRVLGELGVSKLIVTNASGGVTERMSPGTIMVITDHINLMGGNPLVGANNDDWGDRYPDMTYGYTPSYIKSLMEIGAETGCKVERGVYCAMIGPSFETPAEIKMIRILGGDAVGMSTVPEVIVANHMGMNVCGLTCISNYAAGITLERLTHEEVIKKMQVLTQDLKRLIFEFINREL